MNEIWLAIGEFLFQTLKTVGASLVHNWKILVFGIILAVTLKTYVNSEKLSKALLKRNKISILASVAFGAFTPLCACGTSAVIVGMMTTALPWGPIMAFLTSSPLMSPDGFVLISGVIGLRFALALTVASLAIGIGSGLITNVIEKHTNFLTGQSRFQEKEPSCSCSEGPSYSSNTEPFKIRGAEAEGCSCNSLASDDTVIDDACNCDGGKSENIQVREESAFQRMMTKYKIREFVSGLYTLGFKQILVFYSIFVAVGYMINYFIPSSIITVLFGADSFYAVPMASLIGLPLYITTDSGIPIIQSMLNSGASEGAMLAFMITGSATSAWVIAGLTTFMKKRALALYFVFVLLGGILSGYIFDLVNLFL